MKGGEGQSKGMWSVRGDGGERSKGRGERGGVARGMRRKVINSEVGACLAALAL